MSIDQLQISPYDNQSVFHWKHACFLTLRTVDLQNRIRDKTQSLCHDDTYRFLFDKWELGSRLKCWVRAEQSVSIAYDHFAQWLRQFHYVQAWTLQEKNKPQREHDHYVVLGNLSLDMFVYIAMNLGDKTYMFVLNVYPQRCKTSKSLY